MFGYGCCVFKKISLVSCHTTARSNYAASTIYRRLDQWLRVRVKRGFVLSGCATSFVALYLYHHHHHYYDARPVAQ
ncbi:hypothetical protein ARMGADRAFT_438852 [Armillaria gallica]|uniref:Uncharacterized protein n=1 Tax=Armillaria gallica TaxID=47427 RepID=A0A2H3CY94_ARMGA|nr:hypothetical protein ARMGADRAFT_438852 [Armillaria gallica]